MAVTIDPVEELKLRYNTARPRGRDVKRMEKLYTCRQVLFTCSNGWRVERLARGDYPLEGFFMGHCLGGVHAHGSTAVASLREPDGTPHVTFTSMGGGAHGRCNAFPRKYVHLVNEWREHLGLAPYDEATIERLCQNPWGVDNDDTYHENHKLDDKDYRDLEYGSLWRDAAWRQKRGNNGT